MLFCKHRYDVTFELWQLRKNSMNKTDVTGNTHYTTT